MGPARPVRRARPRACRRGSTRSPPPASTASSSGSATPPPTPSRPPRSSLDRCRSASGTATSPSTIPTRPHVSRWRRGSSRCGSSGVKFNVGADPAQLDRYAERLASWVALLPEERGGPVRVPRRDLGGGGAPGGRGAVRGGGATGSGAGDRPHPRDPRAPGRPLRCLRRADHPRAREPPRSGHRPGAAPGRPRPPSSPPPWPICERSASGGPGPSSSCTGRSPSATSRPTSSPRPTEDLRVLREIIGETAA